MRATKNLCVPTVRHRPAPRKRYRVPSYCPEDSILGPRRPYRFCSSRDRLNVLSGTFTSKSIS